ncbi:hypothetical protein DERP_007674 [Dermatophagoides pteronyssinus]|uniref:Uncharacterized protein n=1 Tax=Dermatophagoides pteronyssinus TaxID=6956 RepID=A0ABQ8JKE1_DERPT|nr:hypothetical protein DERP_007674 [Dermatophagoides pteronyssinus]
MNRISFYRNTSYTKPNSTDYHFAEIAAAYITYDMYLLLPHESTCQGLVQYLLAASNNQNENIE